MPHRMRAYAVLVEEKYQLPTYPILINILKINDETYRVYLYQNLLE